MVVKPQIFTGLTLASTPAASSSSSTNNLRLCVVKRHLTTPFFGVGVFSKTIFIYKFLAFLLVGAFKVEVVKFARSNKICDGALGARMNLFDPFDRVVKSYAIAVISSFEDLIEMSDDLTKMRQATAQISSILNCYLFIQHSPVIDIMYRKAQISLEKGDENLAREALKMRKSLHIYTILVSFQDNANSLKAQLDQQKGVVENLVSNTRFSEMMIPLVKIEEFKRDSYPARGDLTEEVCHRADGYNLND
ncbi:hypothetical protein G4B88_029195, partial [Cannabis sativa]